MDENGRGKDLRDLIVVVLLLALPLAWLLFLLPQILPSGQPEVSVSRVAAEVRAGNARALTLNGNGLKLQLTDGQTLWSHKEDGVSVEQQLKAFGVTDEQLAKLDVRVEEGSDFGWLGSLTWILPILVVLGVAFFLMRQPSNATNTDQTLSFLKSRARRIVADRPRVRYEDVAGVDEAKEEMAEVVEFLRNPSRFSGLGARVPRGVLLVGPPGTGKTLLARAVAGEAGVPFFNISGSEFVEMFVGVGASRVRDLFDQAKRGAPCIVFIDEIDAVGRQRGIGIGGGHDEREQTLNQILVEMDGFDKHTNVVVIAATNRPDVLDPALLRPGRFDRRVVLDGPDIQGRLAILKVHARGKPLAPDANLERIGRETAGFSGADLENLLNEAAILSARRGKTIITMAELEEAIDRVLAGPERRSRLMTQAERMITAYHEAGHAIVANSLPSVDPVHKITIVPRGLSGGHTRLLPTTDHQLWTRGQLLDLLAFALGGLAAEEMVFGEATTGPGSDLEHATGMARRMVCEYGMSEELGPVVLAPRDLPRDGDHQYSDETAGKIDREIIRLVHQARDRAHEVLGARRELVRSVADLLLERETLQGDELVAALAGELRPFRTHELKEGSLNGSSKPQSGSPTKPSAAA